MGEPFARFLIDAVDHLNAVESAFLGADENAARTFAGARLGMVRVAAARLSLTRAERIAGAAAALAVRGESRVLLLRAMLRLRDILHELKRSGVEPGGDDKDLVAAAGDALPLADTLARARDRLLEIAPAERDPRLAALITRLVALGAELEKLEVDGASNGNDAHDTAA